MVEIIKDVAFLFFRVPVTILDAVIIITEGAMAIGELVAIITILFPDFPNELVTMKQSL